MTDTPENDAVLAQAALLIHVAQMDGAIGAEENALLPSLFGRAFGLDAAESADLLDKARAAEAAANDLYGWTRIINAALDDAAKRRLLGFMWEVVYADDTRDDFEASLLRRATGLLYISDREAGDIRKQVLAAKKSAQPPEEPSEEPNPA